MADEDRRFGELPLAQTVAAATAIRRLSGMLLSLEHPHPTVDAMLRQFSEWERELAPALPADPRPRAAGEGARGRLYLQHAFDVGAYNPCFPEYRFDHLDAETASGSVCFPVVFEGPPGLVHGGFLGVFFDCVIQHQSCAAGAAGKTRSLRLGYRRPTPVGTELRFAVERTSEERGVTATAWLTLADELLCTGEAMTVALPPERLAANRFGRRRAV